MSGPTHRQSPGCPLALPLAATTTRKTKGNQSLGQETPRPRALSPSNPNKSTACALEAGMQTGCSHCHRAGDDRGSGADHGAPSTCTCQHTRSPDPGLEGVPLSVRHESVRAAWQRSPQYRRGTVISGLSKVTGHLHTLRTLKTAHWSFLLVTRQLVWVGRGDGKHAHVSETPAECQAFHFAEKETEASGGWSWNVCPNRLALHAPYSTSGGLPPGTTV